MLTRRVTLLLAAMAAAMLIVVGVSLAETAPQGTLDANNLGKERLGEFFTGISSYDGREFVAGQQFTAESTGTLTSAQVKLSTNRDLASLTGGFTMEITEVEPSGTYAGNTPTRSLASTTIPASEISDHLVTGVFSNPAQVESGQQYALLLRSESTSLDYQFVYSGDSYSSGWVLTGNGYPQSSGWSGYQWLGYGTADLIFATYVTPPPDTTPPTVSSTSPSSNATGVDAKADISATFLEEGSGIDPNTLHSDSVKVEQVKPTGNVPVLLPSGSFDESSQTATFTPRNDLAKGLYRVTISTGVKDKAGNPLASDYTWQFATAGPKKK